MSWRRSSWAKFCQNHSVKLTAVQIITIGCYTKAKDELKKITANQLRLDQQRIRKKQLTAHAQKAKQNLRANLTGLVTPQGALWKRREIAHDYDSRRCIWRFSCSSNSFCGPEN